MDAHKTRNTTDSIVERKTPLDPLVPAYVAIMRRIFYFVFTPENLHPTEVLVVTRLFYTLAFPVFMDSLVFHTEKAFLRVMSCYGSAALSALHYEAAFVKSIELRFVPVCPPLTLKFLSKRACCRPFPNLRVVRFGFKLGTPLASGHSDQEICNRAVFDAKANMSWLDPDSMTFTFLSILRPERFEWVTYHTVPKISPLPTLEERSALHVLGVPPNLSRLFELWDTLKSVYLDGVYLFNLRDFPVASMFLPASHVQVRVTEDEMGADKDEADILWAFFAKPGRMTGSSRCKKLLLELSVSASDPGSLSPPTRIATLPHGTEVFILRDVTLGRGGSPGGTSCGTEPIPPDTRVASTREDLSHNESRSKEGNSILAAMYTRWPLAIFVSLSIAVLLRTGVPPGLTTYGALVAALCFMFHISGLSVMVPTSPLLPTIDPRTMETIMWRSTAHSVVHRSTGPLFYCFMEGYYAPRVFKPTAFYAQHLRSWATASTLVRVRIVVCNCFRFLRAGGRGTSSFDSITTLVHKWGPDRCSQVALVALLTAGFLTSAVVSPAVSPCFSCLLVSKTGLFIDVCSWTPINIATCPDNASLPQTTDGITQASVDLVAITRPVPTLFVTNDYPGSAGASGTQTISKPYVSATTLQPIQGCSANGTRICSLDQCAVARRARMWHFESFSLSLASKTSIPRFSLPYRVVEDLTLSAVLTARGFIRRLERTVVELETWMGGIPKHTTLTIGTRPDPLVPTQTIEEGPAQTSDTYWMYYHTTSHGLWIMTSSMEVRSMHTPAHFPISVDPPLEQAKATIL
ncbi:hypothetical protein BV22DRAFT_1125665 [Leucogyrophana mollusca]|uniref:Uncharacterized protein n=1 Tax=Leucogyrophana mollusca TaxID=85980 RepID=A0ACB8BVB4_9AGAM|nr:hypothetical protein BV22DRAFT_1125665 [Leucogyrophana mollusca]